MSDSGLTPPSASLDPQTITSRSGSSFLAGFICLSKPRRYAMTVIYAFCRVVDDAVDDAPDATTGAQHLDFWRQELHRCEGGQPDTPVGRALQGVIDDFGVPISALDDLIAGCAMDLDADGIADLTQLELYCYRVASAVGLACLPVLGATSSGAKKFAQALGQALQFTNVLRDLRGDAEIGRCYVPKTWLREFGITAADLLGESQSELYAPGGGVELLCERLVGIARKQFAVVRDELRKLPFHERRALVSPRIMGAIYGDLLRGLEQRLGNIAGERLRVTRGRKLMLALLVWLGVRA